eukprot:1195236-Prorocentrum_minimum.AAC.1
MSNSRHSRSGIGESWPTVYIDGVQSTSRAWTSIPKGSWTNLHLEAEASFRGVIYLMSRVSGASGNTRGTLSEVAVWNRALLPWEAIWIATHDINEPFPYQPNGGLIAYFTMEEAFGSRVLDIVHGNRYADLVNQPIWVYDGPLV